MADGFGGAGMVSGPRPLPWLLAAALRLYREHFGLLFPVPLLAGLVTWLLEFTSRPVPVRASALPSVMRAMGAAMPGLAPPPGAVLVALVVEVFASALLLVLVARVATGTAEPSVGEGLGAALRCLWPLVVVYVAIGVCGGVGTLLLVVPGVFIFTRWAVAPAAVAVEGRGAAAALGRSWRLVRGHFWHTLGAGFFSAVFSWIVLLLGSALGLAFAALPGRAGLEVRALWQEGVTALVAPYSVCVLVLLFCELRARSEGGDQGRPSLS